MITKNLTLQDGCQFFYDNEHQLSALNEEEKKTFLASIGKIYAWANKRADETLDKLVKDLEA